MKKLLRFVVPFLFAVVVAAMPQTVQKVPDALQLKIVRIQKHISDLQIRAQSAKAALDEAGNDYSKSSKDLGGLVDEAYKVAGLKKEEWDLNPETLEFTKKAGVPEAVPSGPAVPAKAEAPKPEQKKP